MKAKLGKSNGSVSSTLAAGKKSLKSVDKEPFKSSLRKEQQGPIDWSHNGLKIKYRGETEREGAYSLWLSAEEYAGKAINTFPNQLPQVISVAKVVRHPFYVFFYDKIEQENELSTSRTRNRLKMKRFVTDVQELWLTNLGHLKEHNPKNMYITESKPVSYSSSSAKSDSEERESGDNGLANRRDKKAIESMHSQIQSVSQKRAFERAYHTTRLPPVMVMLDYEVPSTYPPTPLMNRGANFIYPLPPILEPLIEMMNTPAVIIENGSIVGRSNVVLHIDRLIPSSDFRNNGVQVEVLWRISLWRGEFRLSSSCFVCREADVSQYIAETIMRKVNGDGGGGESDGAQRTSEVVYAQQGNLELPWLNASQLSALPVDYLTISIVSASPTIARDLISTKKSSAMATLKIVVCAEIDGKGESSRLFTECTPAEVRRMLSLPPNKIPLCNLSWLTSPDRKVDLWPQFVERLSAQLVAEGEDSPGQPALCLRFDKSEFSSQAERIEGALSSQEALFCAYELLDMLVLEEDAESRQLFVHLDNLSGERMFSNFSTAVANMDLDEQPFQKPYPPPSNTEDNASFASYLLSEVAPTIDEGHQWEQIAMNSGSISPSASMLASGALTIVTQVPGANEVGRKGLWFPNRSSKPQCEFTRVSARFFRDSRISTSDSVLVNLTLCLDSSVLFPTMLAWEDFSSHPPSTPGEEVAPIIPDFCNKGGALSLLRAPLDSPLSDRISSPVVVFSTTPHAGLDYASLETLLTYSKPGGRAGKRLPMQQSETRKQMKKQLEGLKRHVPFRNVNGFQEQVCVPLLGCDSVLATVVFGITKLGAQPNSVGVNSRNIWHSTVPITEHINRPRGSKDFHYIVKRVQTSGTSQPATYTTRMKASECVGLRSSKFSEYEDKYKAVQEMRDVFNKQVALEERIQRVESNLAVKRTMEKNLIQRELQRRVEKKLRKATKSELGWRIRCLRHSSLVELQGNWERRKDDRTGAFFFHRILPSSSMYQPAYGEEITPADPRNEREREKYLETCQWEVPAEWDGDPLALPDDPSEGGSMFVSEKGSKDAFFSLGTIEDGVGSVQEGQNNNRGNNKRDRLAASGGAFDEPPDSWFPSTGETNKIPRREDATKTIKPKTAPTYVSSDRGLKSVSEPSVASVDTAHLEHIAEQLVSSDELMRVIARRLGLSENQVVPVEELDSVFSSKPGQQLAAADGLRLRELQDVPNSPALAPRDNWLDDLHEPEFDSDDDLWSDEDDEAGDNDEELDLDQLPSSLTDAAALRRQAYRESHQQIAKSSDHLRDVPPLNFAPAKNGGNNEVGLHREDEFGWRRLPRPVMRGGFLSRLGSDQTHTQGPDKLSANTLNKPLFLVPISPLDACKYAPEEFITQLESIFIPDAKKDIERAIATVQRNIKREEELQQKLPTDDLLLFGEAKEFTSADALIARQNQEDKRAVEDPLEEAQGRAILAAKATNISQMEDALAAEIPINTADPYGNSLLILAAQQGSQRMCKFLLRRGANINQQNLMGNTVLHFCYVKGNKDLAEYLKSKGADDRIINVDGLTCYEGISLESMKQLFGDDAEIAED